MQLNNIDTVDNSWGSGCNPFELREGDLILVISIGGFRATGVFIRIMGNFLIWVRVVNNVPVFTLTSLTNITISKI